MIASKRPSSASEKLETGSFVQKQKKGGLNAIQAKEENWGLAQKADWIMANTQQKGYYRVFYDNKTMYSIHQALMAANHSNIHENNRAQFIDDLLSFARAGYLNYYETLQML
uniref:ERAP1-like C-terminal domain-containing protein n=1 Tax=Megaselia scalaris TaxID=36166 RepID=T1H308_MEGSC